MKKETIQLASMLVVGVAIGAIAATLYLDRENVPALPEGMTAKEAQEPKDGDVMSVEKVTITPVATVSLPGVDSVAKNNTSNLSVSDQPAGSRVVVSGFSFAAPGWVAIYDNREAVPGWILGAKRFLPGDQTGVVELLRETKSGETYYAVIHGDDGDLEFDKRKDVAPEGATIVSFLAK